MSASAKPDGNLPNVEPLTKRKAWVALGAHYQKIQNTHLRNLFGGDPVAEKN